MALSAMKAAAAAENSTRIHDPLQGRAAFVDEGFSGMTEHERAAEAERQRQLLLEEASQLELEAAQASSSSAAAQKMLRRGMLLRWRARIVDFDPKQEDGIYHNRLFYVFDPTTFDYDEESPICAMKYTDRVSKPDEQPYRPDTGVNMFSVKVSTSDVGFPIHVYGTVIVRDSVDKKCLYIFRRDRDHSQLISSEDDSLMLTGPKRGIVLIGPTYVEMDLKIKDHKGKDRELSKGVLEIRGTIRRRLDRCEVETSFLATRLSTMAATYAVVPLGVEATIAVSVVQGEFLYGEINAHTTSIQNRILLYSYSGSSTDEKEDEEVAGRRMNGRVLRLSRQVVSVSVNEKLVVVVTKSKTDDVNDGENHEGVVEFAPALNGYNEEDITLVATKMHIKVTWSIVHF